MKVFIVPGHGLPENISKDKDYLRYLEFVHGVILNFSAKHPRTKITIIFSGGNSDLDAPYTRTESEEMANLFNNLFKSPKSWKIRLEKGSLSSLENQVFSKEIIQKIKNVKGKISIFADKDRVKRVKGTASHVLGKVSIIPIDLSSSLEKENKALIKRKEKFALQFALWSFKNRENFNKAHRVYLNKFKILRAAPKGKRKEVEIEWWRKSLEQFKKEAVKYQ